MADLQKHQGRAYDTPRLVVYGDIRSITQSTSANQAHAMDGNNCGQFTNCKT